VRLMQFDALFMALLIDPPSVKAATAMPVPTIARMSAYSAAEAPLSSNKRFLIMVMSLPQFPAGLRRPQLFRGRSGFGFVEFVGELVRPVIRGMPIQKGSNRVTCQ
jgi:hypothetical protein